MSTPLTHAELDDLYRNFEWYGDKADLAIALDAEEEGGAPWDRRLMAGYWVLRHEDSLIRSKVGTLYEAGVRNEFVPQIENPRNELDYEFNGAPRIEVPDVVLVRMALTLIRAISTNRYSKSYGPGTAYTLMHWVAPRVNQGRPAVQVRVSLAYGLISATLWESPTVPKASTWLNVVKISGTSAPSRSKTTTLAPLPKI